MPHGVFQDINMAMAREEFFTHPPASKRINTLFIIPRGQITHLLYTKKNS